MTEINTETSQKTSLNNGIEKSLSSVMKRLQEQAGLKDIKLDENNNPVVPSIDEIIKKDIVTAELSEQDKELKRQNELREELQSYVKERDMLSIKADELMQKYLDISKVHGDLRDHIRGLHQLFDEYKIKNKIFFNNAGINTIEDFLEKFKNTAEIREYFLVKQKIKDSIYGTEDGRLPNVVDEARTTKQEVTSLVNMPQDSFRPAIFEKVEERKSELDQQIIEKRMDIPDEKEKLFKETALKIYDLLDADFGKSFSSSDIQSLIKDFLLDKVDNYSFKNNFYLGNDIFAKNGEKLLELSEKFGNDFLIASVKNFYFSKIEQSASELLNGNNLTNKVTSLKEKINEKIDLNFSSFQLNKFSKENPKAEDLVRDFNYYDFNKEKITNGIFEIKKIVSELGLVDSEVAKVSLEKGIYHSDPESFHVSIPSLEAKWDESISEYKKIVKELDDTDMTLRNEENNPPGLLRFWQKKEYEQKIVDLKTKLVGLKTAKIDREAVNKETADNYRETNRAIDGVINLIKPLGFSIDVGNMTISEIVTKIDSFVNDFKFSTEESSLIDKYKALKDDLLMKRKKLGFY